MFVRPKSKSSGAGMQLLLNGWPEDPEAPAAVDELRELVRLAVHQQLVVGEAQLEQDRDPFLGDLPYVGVLFTTPTKTQSRSELLVFITPRIVRDSLTQR